ncbi:MAG: ABC transporter ATP-binding protein/permease [Prevotella sp.]|nr:ABC transporter ATP-binding protein/permease [Prevotella sp.]
MKRYISWLWQNTSGIRLNMLVRIAAGLGRVGLGLLMVWLCKYFIDVTIHTGTTNDIILMVGILVGIVMAGIVCRQVYYYLGVKAQAVQSTSIRLRIFSHLFRRQLYDQKEMHSGDITSRLEKDIDVISDATTSLFPDLCVTGTQLFGAFLLMQSMDARLAWALLLMTPALLLAGKYIARRLRNMTLAIRKQESGIQMLVQESMEHNAVLRSLESGDWITGRLDEMQQDLKVKINRRARFTVISRMVIATSFSLGYIIAFIWGGLQLREGIITFGVMTSFLQLVGQIQQPILQLVNMMPQMIHASASIDRLSELEEVDSEDNIPAENASTAKADSKMPMGISMQDISFSYAQGDRNIFSHFSHNFTPGSKTALMGHTGSGKTTLFRLLLALIRPQEGTITVYNGHQKKYISEKTRSSFVFVPQGNTLMSGSIRYNLLLAQPDATEEQLRQVLHTAMADFVLELPDGMDTECGERGNGLSEGQAQRIAIARGLLRPGSILLLDEISASLDEHTEQELYRRLFTTYPQKTMIFITHRTAVCQLCDQVITIGE